MTEERAVPDLPDLLAEIDGVMQRLDTTTAPVDALSEIKNTILPLLKDVVASVGYAMEDMQDLVNPIKLTGADAEEIGTLLGAFLESQKGQPGYEQLKDRIEGAIDVLSDEDEDAEGDDEPEN